MTPTREQLARAIDAIMADLRGRSGVLDGVDRDVQDEMRSELVGVLAAALAAPPPEPQAMPPIEPGDWVRWQWFPNDVKIVEDAEMTQMVATDYGGCMLLEIRKANGTVWTREPRR